MKQAFIYSTKVWATTLVILCIILIFFSIYHSNTNGISRYEGTDESSPLFIGFIGFMLFCILLPSWLIFTCSVYVITKNIKDSRQKVLLNLVAVLLITITVYLVANDLLSVFWEIASSGGLLVSINVWLYKLQPVNDEPSTLIIE
jgi:formate hydrogenlyase subunit 3/multisubunit Na+/H+ antiporter MnhD subunit